MEQSSRSLQTPLASGDWGFSPVLVIFTSFYYYNFYRLTALALKRFNVVKTEQRTKCTYFSLQTLEFLLMAAQKYYLPSGAGHPIATPLYYYFQRHYFSFKDIAD